MGLLNLIEKDNRVRFSSDCFCQLSAFFITNISRRRSDQSGHGELLHVFTHIDTHHIVLIIKQILCQCLGKFCLTNTSRAKEQERTNRSVLILDTCLGTDNRFCDFRYTFFLTDDTFVKFIVQMKDLITLALCQLCNRNTCPSGHDSGNLFISDTFTKNRILFSMDTRLFLFQLFLQLRQLAVLKFSSLVQIIIPLSQLNLLVQVFNLFTQALQLLNILLLIVPFSLLNLEIFSQFGNLMGNVLQTFLTELVVLFLQSSFLNLQLHDLTRNLIQLCRHRIKFCLDHCTGFIHKVDCLIRKETIGNVSM